jgi:hypothetical protein
LYDELRDRLPSNVHIAVQPVTKNGRGADIDTEVPTDSIPAWPCIPNGMVVRYDGTVSPCCAGLVDQRVGHPFQYEPASRVGLVAAHHAWCTDPLLQLIRSVGFGPVLQWVREAFPNHEFAIEAPRHPCECCVNLWRDPAVLAKIRRRADMPENRSKVAQLTQVVFGETYMQE